MGARAKVSKMVAMVDKEMIELCSHCLLESDSKKRSRGAIQRARKRQKQDDCLTEKSVDQQQGSLQVKTFSTRNPVAGRGARAEVISDEKSFVDKHFHSDLPDIHSRVSTERTKVMKRARWFDES